MRDFEIELEADAVAFDHDIELEDDTLALDRRTIDVDGRMHVEACNISKACVNDYLGVEIPGYAELGLDPNKIYKLYRDAAALKAAAPTFENLQLMDEHVGVSANDPQKERIAGVVSNVRWAAPYLVGDLAIWDADSIRAVKDRSQADISCGYRYVPIMQPGTIDGEDFDGRMTQIIGNHVALVSVGRVGSDVVVRDEAPARVPTMADAIRGYDRLRGF
jgi:hypothetical protein